MRANRYNIISIILAIFLSFFNPLNRLGLNIFPDNMYTESLMQESFIDFQYALIFKTEKEFEKETTDDDLLICLYLTNKHLHDIEVCFLCKNCISVKQILFFEKHSRSPPFI